MDLKHFSHPHPLAYNQTPPSPGDVQICYGCNLHIPLEKPSYNCWQCQFFLHEQCFQAPRSLNHHSHPAHPLSLLPYPNHHSGYFICNSCNIQGTAFSYCCSSCDFDLHVHCALNTNNIHTNFTPILHSCVTSPNDFYPPTQPQNYGDPNIPYQNNFPPNPTQFANTQYSFMPEHATSSITPGQTFTNNFPNQSHYPPVQPPYPNTHYPPTHETVSYPTVPANTFAPSHTVNQPTAVAAGGVAPQPQPKGVKHFSHEHLLDLSKVSEKDVKCSGCDKEVSGLTYMCTNSNCTFSLHRECFGLPRELKHKSHAEHPLTLLTAPAYKEGSASCNACLTDASTTFTYHCSTCKFDLHVTCAFLPEIVKRSDHPHNLAIINSLPDYKEDEEEDVPACDVCLGVVDVKNSWFYLCQECDFGTHLDCINIAKAPTEVGNTKEELLAAALIELQVLQLQQKLSQMKANS